MKNAIAEVCVCGGEGHDVAREEEPVSLQVYRGRARKSYIEEMVFEDLGLRF